jgi:ATP-dependent helicase HrpB
LDTNLPIFEVLDELIETLVKTKRVVLTAPPGAGKSTAIPIGLNKHPTFANGKIIVLEPRRLAAKQVASRMAETLGEKIGRTVGYRIKGETKCGKQTKVEVVTEGVLIRMIQEDQQLTGVSTVIFDEFHERSLNADLGLAFCLEIACILRIDLKILVMSATLEVSAVSKLMQDAPIVSCEGKSFPVTPRWQKKPIVHDQFTNKLITDVILKAIGENKGGILVFLPGEPEIIKLQAFLKNELPDNCHVLPLYGRLEFKDQQKAIKPMLDGRKIVLATNVAETSLTIDGIETVIDSGLSKKSIYEASSGMARLVTQKISKAEANQRMGRAGRLSPGVCYKLWSKAQDGSFPDFAPSEIEISDLTSFALELALWGSNINDLALLTRPNEKSLSEAYKVLQMLGAVNEKLQITKRGRLLSKMPLHPRLATIILAGGKDATLLTSLLSNADPIKNKNNSDVNARIAAIKSYRKQKSDSSYSLNVPIIKGIMKEISSLSKHLTNQSDYTVAQLAALAYPDRIGKRRQGEMPRYVLSNGKGAIMSDTEPLRSTPFLVACNLDGNLQEAKLRQFLPITLSEIKELFDNQICSVQTCEWSKRQKKVLARRQEKLGQLILEEKVWQDAPSNLIVDAMLEGVEQLGFFHSEDAKTFLARVKMAGDKFPDMSDEKLMATRETWLAPFLNGIKSGDAWKKFDSLKAIHSILNWEETQLLEKLAPTYFITPLGRKIKITYANELPEISIRIQEMYGQKVHPKSGGIPIRVTFLSPAGRKIQTTTDIVSFWDSSYKDVRKDMRGRYPKHFWPKDPSESKATLKTKT